MRAKVLFAALAMLMTVVSTTHIASASITDEEPTNDQPFGFELRQRGSTVFVIPTGHGYAEGSMEWLIYDGDTYIEGGYTSPKAIYDYEPGERKCFTARRLPQPGTPGTSWEPYKCIYVGEKSPAAPKIEDEGGLGGGIGWATLSGSFRDQFLFRVESIEVSNGDGTESLPAVNAGNIDPFWRLMWWMPERDGEWTCFRARYVYDNGYASDYSPWECEYLNFPNI